MRLRLSATNFSLTAQEKGSLERPFRFALTRFSPAIGQVLVTFSDESGPKGAPTRKCLVVVRFRNSGEVVVESHDQSLESVANRSADRVGRSVARHLERKRQLKRIHRRRNSPTTADSPLIAPPKRSLRFQ